MHGLGVNAGKTISIHAPRKGSDEMDGEPEEGTEYFNPRSPQGERPDGGRHTVGDCNNFNPRSPQGERP